MELSFEQNSAIQLMLSGKNVFLTGSAGTGKSTVINAFKKQTRGNCVIVAPTGVAALNVRGQTIHSFFMLAPGLIDPENLDPIPYKKKRELMRQVDTLIIDEISMVRSDVFAAIDKRLKQVASKANKNKPFGGKQVICCGDFFQLSPIVGTEIEDRWLEDNLNGEFAFQTDLWKQADFNVVVLKEPFRQKDDGKFVKILDSIRHGTTGRKLVDGDNGNLTSIEALNQLCAHQKEMPHAPIRLCTTNREVQSINNEARAKIDAPVYKFNAVVNGKFDERDYPTEAELKIKVGCRVMILCNKHTPKGAFLYINGDCGTVAEIKEDAFESKVRVKLDNGNDVWVACHEWQNIKYVLEHDGLSGKKLLRQEIIGTFVQMPLRLAYAMTIHKAQGMTLDCVDLRLGAGCFAHGQLYTALSRARNIAGLQIERDLTEKDLILDDRVIDFYDSIEHNDVQDESRSISVDIPIEYQQQVKELLAKLQSKSQQPSSNETMNAMTSVVA